MESLSSIEFEPGIGHENAVVELEKGKVLVWKPTTAVDGSTLAEVDADLCCEGMIDEVRKALGFAWKKLAAVNVTAFGHFVSIPLVFFSVREEVKSSRKPHAVKTWLCGRKEQP